MFRGPAARFVLSSLLIQLGVRLALIGRYPLNYSMDAYQRWGAREHLLVQDWLPATQAVIWVVDLLGGEVLGMRAAMALVAAVAMTLGGWVARRMGGAAAGWLFIPVGLFGPFLTWSVVPYQEGTFLLGMFGALALGLEAEHRGWAKTHPLLLVADLLMGVVPLVRYEGWPIAILWVLWRRDRRALWALWGIGLWLVLKGAGVQGHAASPTDFADWEGLGSRFDPAQLERSGIKFIRQIRDTKLGLLALAGFGGILHLLRNRRPASVLLWVIFLGQVAAVAGWMIGLETATYRMQAVPGILLGLFAAASGGLLWARRGNAIRACLVVLALVAGVSFVMQGFDNARRSTRSVRWEAKLLQRMEACTGCRYVIKPRKGIGTRSRHDGCEIVQGLGTMMHGEDFWCRRWGEVPADFRPTHRARWKKGGYRIEER